MSLWTQGTNQFLYVSHITFLKTAPNNQWMNCLRIMWVDQGVAGQGTRKAEAAMSPTSCPSSRPETALNHTVAETALNHTVDSWLQFMIVHNTLHCLMRPRLVIPSPPPLSETSRSRGVSNFLSPSPSSPLLKGLRWCSTLLYMYWGYSLLKNHWWSTLLDTPMLQYIPLLVILHTLLDLLIPLLSCLGKPYISFRG